MKKDFTIILPTTVVWLLTALFLLVYSFDLLNANPQTSVTRDLFSPGVFILFITACFATVSLYSTGFFIDRKPQMIKPLIIGSLLLSGFFLFLSILGADFALFLLLGLPGMGVSLGILATSSGALFSGHSEVKKRGQLYAAALFISAIISIGIIIIDELFQLNFHIPLLLISFLAILAMIVFFFISDSVIPWTNDEFPTPLSQIINRSSVRAYLISHFFVYLMLGVAFTSIAQIGELRFQSSLIDLPFFGTYQIDQVKLFWILVFLGDLLFVIPMGLLSDNIGRKNLIVIGVYGIVIAALIVGLTDSLIGFYFSAFLIGASFSTMHPSLDSAVVADLSPLDSVGRYTALNFIFLLQGVAIGLLIGMFIIPLEDTGTISYVLIGVAVLSLFPLFFVADSYEPLDIYLLLVTTSGMCMFNYDFNRPDQSKITEKDLTLVAGALSAISSFFESLDETHAVLDLVRHGRVFTVQSKVGSNGKELIGTIFANKIDPELQSSLETFLAKFCVSFPEEIKEWIGQMTTFEPAVAIAEDVFGPLLPSKTVLSNPTD